MKHTVKFYNPEQTFTIEADHYKDILKDFEDTNKGFIVKDIKNYGRIIKANVYDCDDSLIDKIKITRQ